MTINFNSSILFLKKERYRQYEKIFLALVMLVTMLISVACIAENNEAVAFKGDYIITAEEAKAKQNDENVIFVDARGEDAAKSGMVKGAVVISWPQIADMDGKKPGDAGWGHVISKEKLSEILSEMGLEQSKELIIYASANADWGEDGRILWELKAAGYKSLKMVDGGYAALVKAGIESSNQLEKKARADVKIENIDYKNIIQTEELTKTIKDYKIVDAREEDEYKGAQKFGEAKGGHIPGAVNIPYSTLYTKDGLLKSNEEIQKMFDELGLKKEQAIVTYCTGGIRSAFLQLVFEMNGYENVKNYDGSYYNWSSINEVEK